MNGKYASGSPGGHMHDCAPLRAGSTLRGARPTILLRRPNGTERPNLTARAGKRPGKKSESQRQSPEYLCPAPPQSISDSPRGFDTMRLELLRGFAPQRAMWQ